MIYKNRFIGLNTLRLVLGGASAGVGFTLGNKNQDVVFAGLGGGLIGFAVDQFFMWMTGLSEFMNRSDI